MNRFAQHNANTITHRTLTFSTQLIIMTMFMYSKRCTPHSHKNNTKCISSVHSARYMRPTPNASCKLNTVSSATGQCPGTMIVPLLNDKGNWIQGSAVPEILRRPQTFITANTNRPQMGHTISKLHPTCSFQLRSTAIFARRQHSADTGSLLHHVY